jgi:YVTN family beta-propeller protein
VHVKRESALHLTLVCFVIVLLLFSALWTSLPGETRTEQNLLPHPGPERSSGRVTAPYPSVPDPQKPGTATEAPPITVQSTLFPSNDTLVSGNIVPPSLSELDLVAYDSANGYIYAAGYLSSYVAVINSSTWKVVSWISVGLHPDGLAIAGMNNELYVPYVGTDSLTVINTSTDRIQTNISIPGVAGAWSGAQAPPVQMAYDPSNRQLYLIDVADFDIIAVNTTSNSVAKDIQGDTAFPYGIAYVPSTNTVYVSNNDNEVGLTLIDPNTDSATGTISLGSNLYEGMAYDPISGDLYVSCDNQSFHGSGGPSEGNVTVFDPITNSTVASIVVGGIPDQVNYDPIASELDVANSLSVSIINDSTNTVAHTVGGSTQGLFGVWIAGETPAGDLFVASGGTNLTVVNPSSGTVVSQIQLGLPPVSVAVYDAAASRFLFDDGGTLLAVDPTTDLVTGSLTADFSSVLWYDAYPDMSVDPVNGLVYVTSFMENAVTVVDANSMTVVATIPIGSPYDEIDTPAAGSGGPIGITYDAYTGEFYTANELSENLTIINPSSERTNGSVTLPTPSSLVGSSKNGSILYAVSPESGQMFLINARSGTVTATVSVGGSPAGVTLDPATGSVYVSNSEEDNVSVVDLATGQLVQTIGLAWGADPGFSALDPVDNQLVVSAGTPYFSNITVPDSLQLVNTSTGTPSGTRSVGQLPFAIAYDPVGGQMAVGNYVTGSITILSVPATPQTGQYPVHFTESGLVAGTAWSVTLNGTQDESTTGTASFAEPNGTYPFTVEPVAGYTGSPSSGSVTVDGTPVNQSVEFTATTPSDYAANFTESGLPVETNWSVTVGGTTHLSTSNTVAFTEANGSYPYSVGSAAGYGPNPSNGTFTVSGVPVSVAIAYSPVYALNFTETTLSPGTNWSVTLTGSASSVILISAGSDSPDMLTRWSESASTIRFYVSNGSYSYSAFAPGRANITGTLNVEGAPGGPIAIDYPINSTPSAPSGIPIVDYAIIGLAVTVVVIALGVVLMRRRGKAPPSSHTPDSTPGPSVPP